ncbi:MAG: hypothetical protein KUG77_17845 [Nannocystaceae bacterium]|nr:hypothetical protein [Nannocystaceae bacterium]
MTILAFPGVLRWMSASTRAHHRSRWFVRGGWMVLVLVGSVLCSALAHAESSGPGVPCARGDQRLVSAEHNRLFRIEAGSEGVCDRLVVYALGSRARLSSHALPDCDYGCGLGPVSATATPRLVIRGRTSLAAYDLKRRRLGDSVTPVFRGEGQDAQSGLLSLHGLIRGRFLLCYVVDSGTCLFDLGRSYGPTELAHVESSEDWAGLFRPFPGVHVFRESASMFAVVYGRKDDPTMLRARRLKERSPKDRIDEGLAWTETFTCEDQRRCHYVVIDQTRSHLVIDLHTGKRHILPRRINRARLQAFVGRPR